MRTIYIHGIIDTMTQGMARAMVVDDRNVIYVGENEVALTYQNDNSQVVDLEGCFVTAGFNDSHMHLLGYGSTLYQLQLAEHTHSIQDVIETARSYLAAHPLKEGEWLRGRGWNHDYFSDEKRFLNRYDLDKISTQHPICLIRACGHVCVVNSKALDILGIDASTSQVEGGRFDVDEKGQPLGIFRENALGMVYNAIPQPTLEQLKEMILASCRSLNAFGITSSQTDDFETFDVGYRTIIQAYQELEQEGLLTVKVNEQAQLPTLAKLKQFIADGYTSNVGSEYFKIGPLKLLGDGSLGARTAYLTYPYADDPEAKGILCFDQKTLDDLITYAHTHGMYVAVHCIGDGIMKMVMQSYRKVLSQFPKTDHRHGIVHCQITDEGLLEDFEDMQIHAYIQPIFLDYDIHIVEKRIGKQKAAKTYQFKRLYNQHASSGSDAPVELPDVLAGMQCAITRCTLNNEGPFIPSEALTVEEALRSYTLEGAYASFEEKIKGSLEAGKRADFVILDQNPYTTAPSHIKEIQVLATYLDGREVYRRTREVRK